MKIIQEGTATEPFPYNRPFVCEHCHAVFRLEPGDRFTGIAELGWVTVPCPCCTAAIALYADDSKRPKETLYVPLPQPYPVPAPYWVYPSPPIYIQPSTMPWLPWSFAGTVDVNGNAPAAVGGFVTMLFNAGSDAVAAPLTLPPADHAR